MRLNAAATTPHVSKSRGRARIATELAWLGDCSCDWYSVVLITDGTPALCTAESDPIEPVVDAAASAASAILTHVIALQNSADDNEPNPSGALADLELLARAGGTNEPFVIPTGEPSYTQGAIESALHNIRDMRASCRAPLPEPPAGQVLDPDLINLLLATPPEGDSQAPLLLA